MMNEQMNERRINDVILICTLCELNDDIVIEFDDDVLFH